MKSKMKDKIIAIGFIVILLSIFLINIIVKDKQVSSSERRMLAQMPKTTAKKIMNGETFNEFEKYAMDQFVARDMLRSIKSYFSMNIFRQRDNNKLFIKDETIYKIEYPLNKKNIEKSANRINEVIDTYLNGMDVYYSIIPDKNYYLEDNEYLKMNYEELEQIMKENMKDAKYIRIWDNLSLQDYYRTDIHWKQENLLDVIKTIQDGMNLEDTSDITYDTEELGNFYGVYRRSPV